MTLGDTLAAAIDGRHQTLRTLHPYGLVVHSGRWYVTGAGSGIGADRTFRLDRIADARTLPGSFEPPAGLDPVQRVLSGLARTPYRHEVSLRIQGRVEQIRTRLPASVAMVEEPPSAGVAAADTDRWLRVELRAERLDWLPAVLASLDRPFVIERPDELRCLVIALADRLAAPPGTVHHTDDRAADAGRCADRSATRGRRAGRRAVDRPGEQAPCGARCWKAALGGRASPYPTAPPRQVLRDRDNSLRLAAFGRGLLCRCVGGLRRRRV